MFYLDSDIGAAQHSIVRTRLVILALFTFAMTMGRDTCSARSTDEVKKVSDSASSSARSTAPAPASHLASLADAVAEAGRLGETEAGKLYDHDFSARSVGSPRRCRLVSAQRAPSHQSSLIWFLFSILSARFRLLFDVVNSATLYS